MLNYSHGKKRANLDKIATVKIFKIIQHLLVTLGQQLIITTLIASFENMFFECEMDTDCPVC